MKALFNREKTKGFTLLELLVVITIIGILATVLMASFATARENARDEVRKNDLKALQLAIELYKSQNGTYPARGCGATSGWTGPGSHSASWGTECDEYIDGLVPDYIAELPTDPNQEDVDNWGYIYWTDGNSYKVLAHLVVENKVTTSPDDEFARYPAQCGSNQNTTYAVYSAGAECI